MKETVKVLHENIMLKAPATNPIIQFSYVEFIKYRQQPNTNKQKFTAMKMTQIKFEFLSGSPHIRTRARGW